MRFLTCTFTEHDLVLVTLAAAICILGAWITVRLFLRCRESAPSTIIAWIFLGAVAAGSTIWCTHFVAMLAYRPGVPIAYDPTLTGVSLVVAIIASAVALSVGCMRFKWSTLAGGVLFGSGVAAMHYVGMSAFVVEGIILWSKPYFVTSIILAAFMGAGAFAVATKAKTQMKRELFGTALMVSAIVALHFTGMAAMTIIPSFAGGDSALSSDDANNVLAVAVAGICLLVLGTGLASYLLDKQSADRANSRMKHLMESAVDGAVIEKDGKIIDANSAFEHLSGTSTESMQARSLSDLIENNDPIIEDKLIQVRLIQNTGEYIPVEILARREHGSHCDANIMVYSIRDLRQRIAQERRIAHLARNDSLTGLPNRASFLERLERNTNKCVNEQKLALLAIDLDRFKEVNDLHGHATGDHVLRVLSERMQNALKEGEYIARLGGDEFVAMKKISDRGEALELAVRLEKQLFKPIPYQHTDLTCGAAVGIALFPDNGTDTTTLMNNADLAMYRAKSSLTEAVCFYQAEMDTLVRSRRQTTMELRDALTRGEFELHYQLQASVSTGKVVAYEALLRWKHPQRGYVSPVEFIPLAEETGLILPIGAWVLHTACEQAASWDTPHKVAVNLSAVQLSNIELPRLIHEALFKTGLSPHRLELEITETALVQDAERATHILRQIKALGVSVAMDDFGVGYSSLSTLRAFPFDKIKLDKSFMAELDSGPQASAIIRAVLALGESLDIPVLAEGVETEHQLAFLKELGCDEVQGFLLGRPESSITDFYTDSEAADKEVKEIA